MTASRFTRSDIERAIAGAKKAGLAVSGVEIAPDGTIRLLAPNPLPDHMDSGFSQPIDLIDWKRR
jgi:hypothetical protein